MTAAASRAGNADALVIFGISGDLARVMTFRSLYRLERRGLLDCPIHGVAVDDWSVEDLREHARAAIVATGEPLDEAVFERLAAASPTFQGDFNDEATYRGGAKLLDGVALPVFYLEIPPFLFGKVVGGLTAAGVTRTRGSSSRSRSATTSSRRAPSPRSSTDTWTSRRSTASTTTSGRWGSRRSSTCALRTRCSSRSGTATTSRRCRSRWPRASASRTRGHFYDPVGALRDVVVNHLMQLVAAVAMEPPSRARPERDQGRGLRRLPGDGEGRPARVRARPGRGLPLDSGRRSRLDHGDLRGAPARRSTTGAGRVCRSSSAREGVAGHPDRSAPQSSSAPRRSASAPRLTTRGEPARDPPRPDDGIRVRLQALRTESPDPSTIMLDMRFADEGGEGPTPYEVLLRVALVGDAAHFTRQDGVEEAWRVMHAADRRPAAGPSRTRPAPGGRRRPIASSPDSRPGTSRGSTRLGEER